MSDNTVSGGSLQLYRRLLSYSWLYKNRFLLAIVGMVATAISDAGLAALMKPMIDGGFVQRDPSSIRYVPLILVALFLARGAASFTAEYLMNWVGRRVVFDIRNQMFSRLIHLPSTYFDHHSSGTLVSKLIYDVEQVAATATRTLTTIVQDNVTVIALFSWMLWLNWKLTLSFVVLIPLVGLLIKTMSRRFRRTSRGIQESVGTITHVAQEAIAGHRVIKTFGGHEHERATFLHANENNRRQAMKKAAVAASGIPLIQMVAAFAVAGVVFLALQEKQSAGSFVSYIGTMMMMMAPIKRLTQVNETIQTGLTAAQSVFGLIDETAERDNGHIEQARVNGRIEYHHVHFDYPQSQRPTLTDVSFVVEPGQTLALVGASGSGKSTIASLLPRFYSPSSGTILLDGIDINDFKLKNLRSHIAIVTQETMLFDDSVRNNIAYGLDAVTEAALLAAADAANVTEFVRTMPQGFDTMVGEKGVRLSGGQRQRIAIARALLKNTPILILDEATSALDTASERLVQAAMQRLMQNRTTLVIAHRLSTIESADRILVLQNGSVIESGTHAELIAHGAAYANLHRLQFNERA